MSQSTANPCATSGSMPAEAAALVAALQSENQALRAEIKILHQKIDALVRRCFGTTKNESSDSQQLDFLAPLPAAPAAAPESAAPPVPPKTQRARKPARSGIPDNLPVVEVVLLPEEVKANPEAFRQIEKVITKELDFEPAKFFMRHYVRLKFVRKEVASENTASAPVAAAALLNAQSPATAAQPKEVLIAPLPNRLVEKGMPGVGLLIYLLLSRFEDHLPFYRLEKIFRERYGVPIARQTMVDWVEQLCFWFQPIYEEMKKGLLAGGYLQIDETVIRYLDREEPGHSCIGYFWVYSRPGDDVIFDWQTTRSHLAPKEFLKDFEGKIQTDGYEAYNTLAAARACERQDKQSGLIHFACMAHARRKFIAAKDDDRRALWFVKQIGLLYEVEKRLRQSACGPALRQAIRAAQSKMILARLGKALNLIGLRVLPQSNLGVAIRYTLNLWTELTRYAEHGEVEIDNNLCENAIRPTAIGKKNFLFIGHPEAGGRSAMVYSILSSCRRHGINPAKYLADVLTRLPEMKQKDIATVTPGAWAKAHPEARVLPPK